MNCKYKRNYKNSLISNELLLNNSFRAFKWHKRIVTLVLVFCLSLGGAFLPFNCINKSGEASVKYKSLGRAFFDLDYFLLNEVGLKGLFYTDVYAEEAEEDNDSEEEKRVRPQRLEREVYEFKDKGLWNEELDELTKEAEESLTASFKSLHYSDIEFNGDRSTDGKLLASIQLTNNFDLPLLAWTLKFENEAGAVIEFKELKDNVFTTLPKEESVFVDTRIPYELKSEDLEKFNLQQADIYLLQDYKSMLHIIYDFKKEKIILAKKSRAYYSDHQSVDLLKGANLEFYYEDGRYQADWTSPYSSGLATISWYFTDKNNNTLVASNARTLYYGHKQYDVFYEVNGRHMPHQSLEFDFSSMKFVGMRALFEFDTSTYYYYDANLNLFY